VLGPRKLSAKASLVCENIYTNERALGGEGIPEGDDIELLRKNVKCGRIRSFESDERELAEEISRLDGVSLDEICVLSYATECANTTFEREGDELRCSSDFKVKILYRDADGSVIPLESVLSGDGVVALCGIPDEAGVLCSAHILSERVECLPTDDGVNVVANLIVKWNATSVYNDEHSVVTDGYSTDFALDNRYSSLNTVSYANPLRESVVFEGVITPDANECGSIKEVLLMGERTRISERRVEDGVLNLGVELKLQGVISTLDSSANTIYSSVKTSENISKKVNLSSEKCGNRGAIVRISDVNLSHKIDGDDIKYTATVLLEVIPYLEAGERILVGAQRDEGARQEKTAGRVTVYYTEPSDTLFSVAKAYHTTSSAILRDNEITVETVGGVERTVLPKRLIIY
jgi:hypothetical protein